jgi:hypothetical protein
MEKAAVAALLLIASLVSVVPAVGSVLYTDSAVPLSIDGFQITHLSFSVAIAPGGSCTDLGCVIDGLSFSSTQGGGATATLANLLAPSIYFHMTIVGGVLQFEQAIDFIDSLGSNWDLGLGTIDNCAPGTLPGCNSLGFAATPATDFVASAQVPEPATLVLVAFGIAGLGFSRRKQ